METNMSEFARSTKKAFSRATTTSRSLNAGMNQEFVDTRRRLNDISAAIKRLSASVISTRQTWVTVARQQRDFSQSLSSSFPQSGAVQQHAKEVEKKLRNIQQDIISNDVSTAPHHQILSAMDKYVTMLDSIQKEYKEVEVSYTEKMRYQRKVDKLEKRSNSNRKHSDRLVRNIQKLSDAQSELDTKIESILDRMRSAFQKHEAILQCAHHAFWMANSSHMETIEEATHQIRAESQAVHKLLLGMEIFEDKQLEPVPRPNLVEASENQVQNQKRIENGGAAADTSTNESSALADSSDSISDTSSVVSASPKKASNQTEIADGDEDEIYEQELQKKVELGIPALPSQKPILPETPKAQQIKNPTQSIASQPVVV